MTLTKKAMQVASRPGLTASQRDRQMRSLREAANNKRMSEAKPVLNQLEENLKRSLNETQERLNEIDAAKARLMEEVNQ